MGQRGSQAAYARHRGVDPSRVTRWKQQRRIPVGADGLIDFAEADRALAESLDHSKAHRARQIAGAELEAAARLEAPGAWLGAEVMPAATPGPADGGTAGARVEPIADLVDRAANSAGSVAGELERPAGAPERPASGPESNAAGSYWTHKAQREATEAALAELKLRERLRELIELREVSRAVRDILSRAANKLQQLPAQVAPVIVGIQDPQKVETLLAERVGQVINELARELDNLAAAAATEQGEATQ